MSFNLADIIIIIVVAIFGIVGLITGFRRSLVSLAGFIVSLLITVLLASIVTDAMLGVNWIANLVAGQESSLFAFFHRNIVTELDYITIEYMRNAYYYGGEQAIDAIFLGGGFDFSSVFMMIIYPLVRSAATSPLMLNSYMGTARDLFALELAYGTAILITGSLLFIVLRILVTCISIVLKPKRPIEEPTRAKKAAGSIVAMILGMLRGFVYAGVILAVLSLMSGFAVMDRPMEEVRGSVIARVISNTTNTVSELVISSRPEDVRFNRLLDAAGFNET